MDENERNLKACLNDLDELNKRNIVLEKALVEFTTTDEPNFTRHDCHRLIMDALLGMCPESEITLEASSVCSKTILRIIDKFQASIIKATFNNNHIAKFRSGTAERDM